MKHINPKKSVKALRKNGEKTILKTSKSDAKSLFIEGFAEQIIEQRAYLEEIGVFSGFQHQNIKDFSSEVECKRKLKRKQIPKYRRINNYYKSIQQYWKERNRRKEAWKLYSEGLNYQQIAEKLSISAKTVSHDLRKVFAYYKGQINREYRLVREARDAEYMEHLNSMTLAEQREQLRKNFHVLSKLMTVKKRTLSTLNITVDIDEILRCFRDKQEYGRPFISHSPSQLYCKFSDFKIHFRLRVGGKLLEYRTLGMNG